MLDEYVSGECSRISPEAPVPIVRVDGTKGRCVLGGAANTAANVASLGGTALLVGLAGDDSAGEIVRALCTKAGVHFLPVADGRPTLKKTRIVSARQQLLRLDYEETHTLSGSVEEAILAQFRRWLPQASIVVLSDYAKGVITESVGRAIIQEAHAAGRQVVVDPRPQHLPHYIGCDYVTPNWKEARELLGLPVRCADPRAHPQRRSSAARRTRSQRGPDARAHGIGFLRSRHGREFRAADAWRARCST